MIRYPASGSPVELAGRRTLHYGRTYRLVYSDICRGKEGSVRRSQVVGSTDEPANPVSSVRFGTRHPSRGRGLSLSPDATWIVRDQITLRFIAGGAEQMKKVHCADSSLRERPPFHVQQFFAQATSLTPLKKKQMTRKLTHLYVWCKEMAGGVEKRR